MNSDLEEAVPRSLDQIIRVNRDEFSLRLSILEDFESLPQMSLPLSSTTHNSVAINDWRVVCLSHRLGNHLFLTGIHEIQRVPWMTSKINSVDFGNNLVLTGNSVYSLGSKGDGDPNLHILLHICATFHKWGLGSALGVLPVYY